MLVIFNIDTKSRTLRLY